MIHDLLDLLVITSPDIPRQCPRRQAVRRQAVRRARGALARRVALVRCVALGMCCGFLALSPGCGGKEDPLTIPPFSRKPTTIQVGEVIGLDVELNRPAPAETTVEVLVEQSLAFAVQLEASRLVFAAGQRVQRIEMTGRNDTDGKFANVIFTISSNGARQIFQLKVDP